MMDRHLGKMALGLLFICWSSSRLYADTLPIETPATEMSAMVSEQALISLPTTFNFDSNSHAPNAARWTDITTVAVLESPAELRTFVKEDGADLYRDLKSRREDHGFLELSELSGVTSPASIPPFVTLKVEYINL